MGVAATAAATDDDDDDDDEDEEMKSLFIIQLIRKLCRLTEKLLSMLCAEKEDEYAILCSCNAVFAPFA